MSLDLLVVRQNTSQTNKMTTELGDMTQPKPKSATVHDLEPVFSNSFINNLTPKGYLQDASPPKPGLHPLTRFHSKRMLILPWPCKFHYCNISRRLV